MYRRNPWASKCRKKKSKNVKTFDNNRKVVLKESLKGSWYNQESKELLVEPEVAEPEDTGGPSRSYRKIVEWNESTDDDDDDDSDKESDFYSDSDNETEPETHSENENIVKSTPYWIIDTNLLEKHLNDIGVCRFCHNNLYVFEHRNHRAGLGTRLCFNCKTMGCNGNAAINGFNTTEKRGTMFTINRQSVIAARMIGRGRQGLLKFSSVMGLSSPVSRPAYSEHTKFIEEKSGLPKDLSLSTAAKTVRHIIAKSSDLSETDTLDMPTSFDGTWGSRGWTARDGVATAIADVTGQVIDIVYKNSSCRDCFVKQRKKDLGEISFIEYVDWYMRHEPICLLNHDGSSSVSFILLHLSNARSNHNPIGK